MISGKRNCCFLKYLFYRFFEQLEPDKCTPAPSLLRGGRQLIHINTLVWSWGELSILGTSRKEILSASCNCMGGSKWLVLHFLTPFWPRGGDSAGTCVRKPQTETWCRHRLRPAFSAFPPHFLTSHSYCWSEKRKQEGLLNFCYQCFLSGGGGVRKHSL